MNPQEFIREWEQVALKDNQAHAFCKVDQQQLINSKFSKETANFLVAGIPQNTASYNLDLFPPLRRVYEIFASAEWTDEQRKIVQPYFALGEDGGGNAICIDELDGRIWLLDHEFFFQKREFINSSLRQFLEFSLLSLRAWVGDLNYADLLEPMKKIDSIAMLPEHTWLQIVLEDIQEEQNS